MKPARSKWGRGKGRSRDRLKAPKTGPRRSGRKSAPRLKYQHHAQLWRLVEGAVVDTFKMHPDYFTQKGEYSVVESVTKRVVGAIVGEITKVQ